MKVQLAVATELVWALRDNLSRHSEEWGIARRRRDDIANTRLGYTAGTRLVSSAAGGQLPSSELVAEARPAYRRRRPVRPQRSSASGEAYSPCPVHGPRGDYMNPSGVFVGQLALLAQLPPPVLPARRPNLHRPD